ncbi:MAG: pilus assembly protein CpaF [Myxococcota bacterium]|jgi:pilus assembly protein CpaF
MGGPARGRSHPHRTPVRVVWSHPLDEQLGGPMRVARGKSVREAAERRATLEVDSGEENLKFQKDRLRKLLTDNVDFEEMSRYSRTELGEKITATLRRLIDIHRIPLSRDDRERAVVELVDDMIGMGPIEPLIADPVVSDIMINGPERVFVERKGKLMLTNVKFESHRQLRHLIERIVTAVGRRVDESTPMVDARMLDGSRFNAIIPPLALDGACVSIRRFGTVPITWEDLIRFGSCPAPVMEVLKGCIQAKLNTIISGGTGSGKTTLLNVLSGFIPHQERIITIEDSAELQLQQEHVVRLETRSANQEGKGAVDQRDLVKNCLRMRPDRIILGETRGAEAIDMLTAMNTGHEGSLATVHANSPQDALARFETMVGIGMPNMGDKSIRETIARALDVIVQQARLADGSRRIIAVTEVLGMEDEYILTQDIFRFERTGMGKDGRIQGVFAATGIKPRFASRLKAHGVKLSDALFEYSLDVT